MINKEKFYENATRKLLAQIDKMGLDKIPRLQAKNFVLLLRDSFKLPDVRQAVFSNISDLDWKETSYYSLGFCRSSSFTFIAFMASQGWQLMYLPYESWSEGPHYYLKHKKSGLNLDITYDQYSFYNIKIPYDLGRKVKIDGEGKFTIVRFLNAMNMDFLPIINNIEKVA